VSGSDFVLIQILMFLASVGIGSHSVVFYEEHIWFFSWYTWALCLRRWNWMCL